MGPIIAFLENNIFATFCIVASINERVFFRSATALSLTFSRDVAWRQSQRVWFVPFLRLGIQCIFPILCSKFPVPCAVRSANSGGDKCELLSGE